VFRGKCVDACLFFLSYLSTYLSSYYLASGDDGRRIDEWRLYRGGGGFFFLASEVFSLISPHLSSRRWDSKGGYMSLEYRYGNVCGRWLTPFLHRISLLYYTNIITNIILIYDSEYYLKQKRKARRRSESRTEGGDYLGRG